MAVLDRQAAVRDGVELRDVLDPGGAGHRGAQRHMQLHQEVRADLQVEGLGQVRHLEPGRDAADPRDVDLQDRRRALLHVGGELTRRVERFADRDRHRAGGGQARVAGDVVGRQRLLEPGDAELGIGRRTAQGLGQGEALVGVDHDLEAVADGLAHGAQPRQVLAEVRLADLDLGALEAGRLRRQRLAHQLVGRQVQPAAFGGVDRDARLAHRRRRPTAAGRRGGSASPTARCRWRPTPGW